MGLGNNRDYTTTDRNARRQLAILKERSAELNGDSTQAAQELKNGKLNDRLKAWVDPILEHKRKMRELRKSY